MRLGQRARALYLLQEAHARGLSPDRNDPEFAPLRADSAYQELFRPKE